MSARAGSTVGRYRGTGRLGLLALGTAAAVFAVPATTAAAAPHAVTGPAVARPSAGPPVVLQVGRIAAQNVPVLPGSEADTLVEPDIAVSPLHPGTALAVAHDGRYPDGGAVGIAYAWTSDSGAHWHSSHLPRLTAATGGPAVWARASDPVAAYGPDGTAYVSTLLFNTGCDTAVAVSRSTDGGRTFGAPVLAHRSSTCAVSDDKNWLAVDTSPTSPHRGRLYQFWTPFLTDPFGNADGSPQAVVHSDDYGRTWSAPVSVTAPHANTQNSQPMLRPDGSIVDAYTDYGSSAAQEGSEAAGARLAGRDAAHATGRPALQPALSSSDDSTFTTRVSRDGGDTWHSGGVITTDVGDGPQGFRCCLSSATADPADGHLYAVWDSADVTSVRLASSTDGIHWSGPRLVDRGAGTRQAVNADVSADRGTVAVSFGLTNADASRGRSTQQYVAVSRDRGVGFAAPVALGPASNEAYAARADGIFPGDYIGSALRDGRLYLAWCVAGRPAGHGHYHQVLYAAVAGV